MSEPSIKELKDALGGEEAFYEAVHLARASPEDFAGRLISVGYRKPAEIERLHESVLHFANWSPAKTYLDQSMPPPPPPPTLIGPPRPPKPEDPTGLAGAAVTIHDLRGRPELNGRRGRALLYDPATGRLGVQIKDVGRLALHPRNLWTDEDVAEAKRQRRLAVAEEEARRQVAAPATAPVRTASAREDEDEDDAHFVDERWTWATVLGRLSLGHLLGRFPWQAIEGVMSP